MRIRKKEWARPELEACPYFVQNPKEQRGRWMERFGEKRPIHLDLGCGKCVFLADIAKANPQVNYIGIDISLDILGVGRRNIAQRFEEASPDNVLLCDYNIEKLPELLAPGEGIERIYINFCNPWPRAGCHKRRLTHRNQLESYKPLLSEDGEIWFKTDNTDLYLATRRYFKESGYEIFFDTADLHAEQDPQNVITEHEAMFTAQGIPTKALRARVIRQ